MALAPAAGSVPGERGERGEAGERCDQPAKRSTLIDRVRRTWLDWLFDADADAYGVVMRHVAAKELIDATSELGEPLTVLRSSARIVGMVVRNEESWIRRASRRERNGFVIQSLGLVAQYLLEPLRQALPHHTVNGLQAWTNTDRSGPAPRIIYEPLRLHIISESPKRVDPELACLHRRLVALGLDVGLDVEGSQLKRIVRGGSYIRKCVRWKREQNLANRRDGMGRGLYAQYAASVVHWRVLHRLLGPEVVPEDTVPKEDARIRRAGRDVRARMDRKAAYRQEKLEELARELTEEAWQDVLDFWEALPKDQKAQYGATKAERAEWRMRQVPRYYRRRVKKEQNWGNYPGLSTDAYQARLLEQGPHALRAMSACRAMFES